MNLQHACFSRPGLSAIVLGGIFIAGCLLEPVGVNKAVGAIPRVVPGETLELSFVVPSAAVKANFELVVPADVEASPPAIPSDEDPEDGFVAKVPTAGLPRNFYEVQMFIEGGEEGVPAGRRSFVIADPSATGSAEPTPDTSATPTATPTTRASTTPAPSPSVRASTTPAPSPSTSASTTPAASPSASASTTPAASPSTSASATPAASPITSASATPGPSSSSSPAAWRVSARLR